MSNDEKYFNIRYFEMTDVRLTFTHYRQTLENGSNIIDIITIIR